MNREMTVKVGMRSLAFLLLLVLIQPALAASRPEINVVANWVPGTTLDTNGADERFVDLQLQVQGNVQFWAVEMSCQIGRGDELEFVSINLPTNVWGTESAQFTILPQPDDNTNGTLTYTPTTDIYNADGRGTLEFTPTRLGITTAPLGINGADYTLTLANVRFRVLPQDRNGSVRVNCRTMEFLDRNGERVERGRQTRTPDLEIITGYVLSGTVARQGGRDTENVEVTCTNYPDGPTTPGTAVTYPSVLTDRRGEFTFDQDGGSELRALGYYECVFISKSDGSNSDDVLLSSTSTFVLRTPQYSLLPVVLRTGNVDESGDGIVDIFDISVLAGVYGQSYSDPYGTGDVNGDEDVDDADLTLTAANNGLDGPLDADHVLYGLGRDFSEDEIFPYSQLWWGFPGEGYTYPLVNRSRTRDFWPQLSPDGTQVAYIAVSDRRGESTYELSYLDVERGRGSTARFPREFDYQHLAPSWSPDGSRVAFICTTRGEVGDPDTEGYLYNNGDICIVNADDSRGDTAYNLGVKSEIFPPAWLEYDVDDSTPGLQAGYVIIYPDFDSGKLRYVDLYSELSGEVPVSAGGSDVLDQPIVVDYSHTASVDGTTNALSIDSFLGYRFSDGGDPYLKVGSISYDPAGGFAGGITNAVDGTTHVALEGTGTPDTTGVDYYDLSPSLDILFYYEYNYAIDNTLAPFQFHIFAHDDANPLTAPLTWNTSATSYFVDSVVGNPFAALDGFGAYDPQTNPLNLTELHANRMTFDWIP